MKLCHFTEWLLIGGFGTMLALSGCTPDLAGATTETTNGIMGLVFNEDSTPATDVVVHLFSADYDPVADTASGKNFIDTTDRNGVYSFGSLAAGRYVVLARRKAAGTGYIARDVQVQDSFVTPVPGGKLDRTGSIAAELTPGSISSGGYAYIPGTDISCVVGSDGSIGLDGIPPGTIPAVMLVAGAGERRNLLRESITVAAGEKKIIKKPLWMYTRRIQLNTTTDGAGVSGTVTGFPVLIRLNGNNFDFSQARSDGADIEFVTRSGVTLPREIEQWDGAVLRAEIWVLVDTIRGNDSTQSIDMYWGNPGAVPQAASVGAVFDTADGYQGVWHLGETDGGLFNDATINKYHGTSPDSSLPSTGEGVIGKCAIFDGKTDFITMPNTADSKLNFPENGNYTVCAWARIDTSDGTSHCVVSKGFEQYYLRLTYISVEAKSLPLWEFVEFSEIDKWQTLSTSASEEQWAFIVGVREGEKQFLYCNGVLADTTLDLWPYPATRTTSNDLYIGRFAKQTSTSLEEGIFHFKGGIDEVRIMSKVENPDWIKLCYMNQRDDDRLVVFQ